MSSNTEKISPLPQLPDKTAPPDTPFGTMNNIGYNPYMYNNMNPYGGGNMFMGNGMFGSGMSSNNPHLPAGLQQSLSLLETILITIGSTTQLIESSYVAAKGLMHTFKEIHIQFQSLRKDFRNGILSAIFFLKKVLLMKRDKTALSGEEKRSLKRLLVFVSLAAGVPLLLKKIALYSEQPVSFVNGKDDMSQSPDGNVLDPEKAQFVRVLYDYVPGKNTVGELAIRKDEILAIISKKDALGNDSQWWRVRNKKGDLGYIPSNYIETLEKKKE